MDSSSDSDYDVESSTHADYTCTIDIPTDEIGVVGHVPLQLNEASHLLSLAQSMSTVPEPSQHMIIKFKDACYVFVQENPKITLMSIIAALLVGGYVAALTLE